MFHTKFLVTVTFLIVVTIIHHGFANKERHQLICENLMSVQWFQDQTLMPGFWFGSDAKANFEKAYFHLTYAQLFSYLDDRMAWILLQYPNQRQTLYAQAKIIKDYFIRLSVHGLTLTDHLKTMNVWCKDKVELVVEYGGIYKRDTTHGCTRVITKTFEIGENDKRGEQYKRFFEDFKLNDLRDLKKKGESSSSRVNTQDTGVQINNYPFYYFKYYGDTILQRGTFQNVEEYCGSLPLEVNGMLTILPIET